MSLWEHKTTNPGAVARRAVLSLRWGANAIFTVWAVAYVSIAMNSARAAESQVVESLHTLDQRVLAISHRLATSSPHRCPATMPALGLTMHSRDQYSQASPARIAQLFPNQGPLAVQALLQDGPASAAGVPSSASILSIGDWTPERMQPNNGQIRLHAHGHVSQLPIDQTISLTWTQGGEAITSRIAPVAACRVLFEVAASEKRFARSNGPIVQISSKFVGMLNDEQLAVVLAHELAHSALEHRRTMEAADNGSGVLADRASFKEFRRDAEIEADRVSLHILRDAEFDPAIGPAFWRSRIGKKVAGGLFRPRRYPSAKKRAALMEQEIGRITLP